MADWLDSVAGPGYTMAIFWTFGALLLLLVLLLIVKLVRSMTFGTFVAGGRNRKTRLAVMDATAVDSHRRLVLVRRDDIEHLLLIGGPTDVVVERDIRLGQQRRVAQPSEGGRDSLPPIPATGVGAPAGSQAPRPRPPETVPVRQAPAPRPVAERPQPAAQQRQVESPPPSRPTLRPEAPRLPTPSTPFPSVARAEPRPLPPMPQAAPFNPSTRVAPPQEEFDDELLKELEVSLEETSHDRTPRRPSPPSLDDEMTKLLGELSTPRR